MRIESSSVKFASSNEPSWNCGYMGPSRCPSEEMQVGVLWFIGIVLSIALLQLAWKVLTKAINDD
jgi:hypothetical protein